MSERGTEIGLTVVRAFWAGLLHALHQYWWFFLGLIAVGLAVQYLMRRVQR